MIGGLWPSRVPDTNRLHAMLPSATDASRALLTRAVEEVLMCPHQCFRATLRLAHLRENVQA